MKTIITATAVMLALSAPAFADMDERGKAKCNASCQINKLPNSATKRAINEVNLEDQRLTDGKLQANGNLDLYTQDMQPGADGDISRRKVTVAGVENMAASVTRDKRLESAINRYATDHATHVAYANNELNSINTRMDGFNSRLGAVESAVGNNRKGIAGTAALASIDFVERKPAVGLGIATWDGEFGYAIKGMVPLSERVHGSVGVFGAGGEFGAAASVVLTF